MAQSISFTDPYAVQGLEIERRRRLAEQLRNQAASPMDIPRPVGGVAVRASPLAGIAKLLQGYTAGQQLSQADQQQRELAERAQGERSAELQSIARALRGREAIPEPSVEAGGGPGYPAVPPDRNQALELMMSSKDPMMQRTGIGLLAQGLTPKPPKYQDVGDRILILDGTTGQKIGEMPKQATPDAQLRDKTTRDLSILNPDVENAKGRVAAKGASNVQVGVQNYAPASVEAQKEFMKSLRGNFERLRDAPSQLANIEKAKKLIGPSAPFVGAFADKKRDIAQFLNNNLGTNIAPEAIANSGELRTRVFQNIMDNLKKMDAQPSQLQQKIMMDALGNLNEDPQAIHRMLDAYASVIKDKVSQHNKEAEGSISRGIQFPYDPKISIPEPEQAAPSAQQIVDELRRRGVIK